MDVRVVGTDEWPMWRDVRLAALTVSPEAFKSRLEDWERGGERRWRERLAMPGAYNIVAQRDGAAVGVASGVPGADGDVELRSVWVDPDARGCGVAGRLIAAVEAWARETGARTLRLSVLRGNDGAMALYRRHGFAFTGESDDRELVMAKALD